MPKRERNPGVSELFVCYEIKGIFWLSDLLFDGPHETYLILIFLLKSPVHAEREMFGGLVPADRQIRSKMSSKIIKTFPVVINLFVFEKIYHFWGNL